MTTEYVLLLGLYAFIILGVFIGDSGPGAVFRDSGSKLAARVERNIAVGIGPEGFFNPLESQSSSPFVAPSDESTEGQ